MIFAFRNYLKKFEYEREKKKMNILLIVTILIFAAFTYEGYRKGLIKIAISMAMMLLTTAIVFALTPVVGEYLRNQTSLYDTISDKTTEFVSSKNIGEELFEKEQSKAADTLKLPETIVKLIAKNNTAKAYKELGVKTFDEYVGGYLACLVIDAIAFVIAYIIVMLICRIILFATNIITRIPGIHGANKILGGAVGFVKGIIVVWFMFIIITMLISTPFGKNCVTMINDNSFLMWIYNNNLLLKIVTGAVSSIW